jgi:type II secretion system protein J
MKLFAANTDLRAAGAIGVRSVSRAFTLIEVLLAVAIFSIVLIAINAVFFGALRLRQRVSENVEEGLPLNQALSVLRRDLQNTMQPGGVLAGYFSSAGPVGTQMTSQNNKGAAGAMAGSANTGGLDFFTSTGVLSDDVPYGDIQEVNYQLMEPLDRANAYGRDLVRSVTRNILSPATQVAEVQRLMSNVQTLDFTFYDGSQWRDAWNPGTGDTNLPVAVRAVIQLAPNQAAGETTPEPLQMVVLLDSQPQTKQPQVAGGAQ